MELTYKDSAKRIALAREIAREGIVLLKNDGNMLPFAEEKVAVFGRTQVDTIKCGTGSAFCESEYCISVLEGMENAGINVDKELAARYRAWCAENLIAAYGVWGSGSHLNPEMPISDEEIAEAAKRTDKAVLVIGRTAGENDDTVAVEGDFMLSPDEKALLSSLKKYYGAIAVIVNSGNLIDLSFTECDEVKALIMLNLPGMEGGNALGDILSGKFSPSGKLTDTVARHYTDYPSAPYFGKKAGTIQKYYEDIFVGYRYFETFDGAREKVLYPFGFGLSYTEFEKTLVSFECDGISGNVCAKVRVKNVGKKYAGKETVMLYSSSPASALGTPKYELRTFEKTKLLAPGEEEVLTLSYPVSRMASFDDTGVLGKADAWVMAKGEYTVYFGNNVEALELAGKFDNPEYAVIKECAHIPTELDKRLTASGEYETLDAIPPDTSEGIPVGPLANMKVGSEQYADVNENITLYRINVTSAGIYKMRLSSGDDISEIVLGERPLASYESYFTDEGAEIILPPGTCEFFITGMEKAPKVAFSFEKEDDTIHISAEGKSIVEGGKFTECALYVIARQFEDEEGEVKVGRGLFRMHTPGRFAMYKFDVEKAGFYDFTLRYTTYHPTRKLEDTYSFMVSNVTQDIESVTLENTTCEEGPHVFRTAGPIRLALPAGEAYLKIVSLTTDTPLLAYMEVTPSTREVVLAEKHKVEKSDEIKLDENTPTDGKFTRHVLPPVSRKYDFRNVLCGELSLDEFVNDLSDEEMAVLSCGNSNGQIAYMPERGIPESYWSDGSVGFRQNYAVVVYPSSTMVAATWNKALTYEFGKSIGTEANGYNVDVWLAPAMNIHRDPCCGRNFEYLSEDPYITGVIVSEIVKGVQKFDVSATVKHFAANNTEYQRMKSNSRVSARAMREIYMKAFEIVIAESSPYSIMTSYNHINGIKVSENPLYCIEILRKEFGFDGMIMSDFANDSNHVRELVAKQDLKMHYGDPKSVVAALADGTINRDDMRDCTKRVLTMLMLTTAKKEKKEQS